MFKILGMLSIFISSTTMGITMAKELKERIKVLKDIYQSAIHIRTDLEYRSPDVSDCFKMRGMFFSKVYKYITEDESNPYESICKTLNEIKSLHEEDNEIIKSYAENLICENIDGQIANITWLIESVRVKIRDAEAEYQSKSKLYKSGGIMVGMGLIILLL